MTFDGVNDPAARRPLTLSDRERDQIQALRRRFEEDAPQGFTDSDSARFESITETLGVPTFPTDRETLLDIIRANGGSDSTLVAMKSLAPGRVFQTYDELLLALGVGTAGRIEVPGVPPLDPEGGAPAQADLADED